MNFLIFSRIIDGHHIEYINHIYQMALRKEEDKFVFVLPSSFENVSKAWQWMKGANISIDLFDNSVSKQKTNTIFKNLLISWRVSKLLRFYEKRYRPDVIYVNSIIDFLPFAPLLINDKVRMCGIIYRIYLYDKDYRSRLSLVLDKIKYDLFSKSALFSKIMILNDEKSPIVLNNIYKTNKFVPIPDPYIPICNNVLFDFREENLISPNQFLFIQFGALNINKATIEILESLKYLTEEEQNQFVFAFAGCVHDEIRNQFYELVNYYKNKIKIVVIDEFCDYSVFASMCQACNAILTPYRRVAQSSGLIGYASQFGKPVIAPSKGLLGNLVKKYELGLLIKDNTPQSLVEAYRIIAMGEVKKPTKKYCEENSITKFQESVYRNLIH